MFELVHAGRVECGGKGSEGQGIRRAMVVSELVWNGSMGK